MTEIKLPFGLNENNMLVHITDVGSGKKCNCVCPACKYPLIAVKGSKKQHHFRHDTDHECERGLESAIHLAAKQIILEKKRITLSECIVIAAAKDSKGIEYKKQKVVVRSGSIISFDSVREETEINGMKADIVAKIGNKTLVIEIFYRHKVDDQKLEKISNGNISSIEIDLSDLVPEDIKDWEAFWSCINEVNRVKWLYNAKAYNDIYPKLEKELEEKIQVQERKYKQEEIKKQKQALKEQEKLLLALDDLKSLCSEDYIKQLKEKSETHPVWKYTNQYLPYSWQELPDFLKVAVPDGDWIFGCDRRVWQTAFYSYFICKKGKAFTIKAVDNWLQNTLGCKVSRSTEIVGIYGRRYPELIPADILGDLPSSWKTLQSYFGYLCKLRILEFSGDDWKYPGSFWFKVINKDAVIS